MDSFRGCNFEDGLFHAGLGDQVNFEHAGKVLGNISQAVCCRDLYYNFLIASSVILQVLVDFLIFMKKVLMNNMFHALLSIYTGVEVEYIA